MSKSTYTRVAQTATPARRRQLERERRRLRIASKTARKAVK